MFIYFFLKMGSEKDLILEIKKKIDEFVFINIKYFLS